LAPDAKLAGQRLEALLPPGASAAERYAILYSHPTWIVERWLTFLGEARTRALLEANNRPPRLSCAVLDAKNIASVADSLRSEGFSVAPARWLRSALTLSGRNATAAEAFRTGQISLQDEASQMVAHLVDARSGQTALDLCAAPGGKTALLARAVAPRGTVIAADLHEHRLRSARAQVARTATPGVVWMALDAAEPLPFSQLFERILLDAPCSGTGTLARNPEIRWRLTAEDLLSAHRRQTTMLRQALTSLARSGRLVYATCSLEPEENEQVVHEAVSLDSQIRVVPGQAALQPFLHHNASAAALFGSDGFFRAFPPESGTDGFFASILERSP
jgi:16S rRNA (cytosine967-C5)-methyltransferase